MTGVCNAMTISTGSDRTSLQFRIVAISTCFEGIEPATIGHNCQTLQYLALSILLMHERPVVAGGYYYCAPTCSNGIL